MKQQLAHRGIGYEALDNGILSCDDPKRVQAMMTYDLRRLRLHGLIQRIPKSHRYAVTAIGLRIALFFCRA